MSPYISHISPVHLPGELLVFNTKTRVRKEGKTVTVCRYVQTLSGHQPYPLGLATLKGFLFLASPELLTVHNVSGLYSRAKDDPVVSYGLYLPIYLPDISSASPLYLARQGRPRRRLRSAWLGLGLGLEGQG